MRLVPASKVIFSGIAATFAAALLSACATPPAPAPLQGTLIRNVSVLPMDREGVLRHRDVLIRNGRVAEIRPTRATRSAEQVIDGTGKYLMPGLWDMHSHAVMGGMEAAREALSLYLSNGVVGVRDLGSSLEDLAAARRELPIGVELTDLVAGGPLLDGPKQPWQQKIALALNTVEEARAAAERLADAGVDFLKIYNNLSAEQFAAIVEVAKRRGLPFAGHVPFKISLEQVSAAGQKSIEHAGVQLVKDCIPDGSKATPAILNAWIKKGYPGRYEETNLWWAKRDPAACRALYRRMAKRGTWVTPTLTNEIQGGIWATPADLALLPPDQLKACRSNLESANLGPALRDAADKGLFDLVLDLHKAGVPLLAGTDTPNGCLAYGSSVHKELQMLRHAGLSSLEVLKMATLNPARFLGRADEGVVRPGAVANLLLLDADPLADVGNTRKIAGVMLKGRWHAPGARGRATDSRVSLYENARVWTGSGFETRTLAVREGRFVDPAEAGGGARRIDVGGRYIVPAYGNAHAHITRATPEGSWSYLKEGVFYVWNPNTVVLGEKELAFFARGDTVDVKTAQGGITEPGGHPEQLYVEVLAKYVYKGKTLKDFLGNAFHYGPNAAEIDAALDLLKSQKADFVKAYLLYSEDYLKRRDDPVYYGLKGLNPVNMPYLVAAARRRGLPVAVHVETAHDLRVAALSGVAVAEHLPGYWAVKTRDDLMRRNLSSADAALVARSGMIVVATYSVSNDKDVGPPVGRGEDKVTPDEVYALQAQNLRRLIEAGTTLIIGTDGPGPIFDEAEHLVGRAGLSVGEALAAVFRTSRYLFPDRRIGCFDPGCEADFLVLGADPRTDIANLRKIERRVKAGQELEPPPATP
jgi:imidazolonepropionase-like amidohydrolase